MNTVFVNGGFDNLKSRDVRFLQEAAAIGRVHVLLWSDQILQNVTGKTPKFPQEERLYFLDAIRYVDQVTLCNAQADPDTLPRQHVTTPAVWSVHEETDNAAKRDFCRTQGFQYRVLTKGDLQGFPADMAMPAETTSSQKRVIVTGCYDWFHSGHVRFFEEVSELGDLYVVVGHDANIKLLKGEGHPMLSEQERRYMAQSVRFVKRAMISTGHGWLDAEPEIERIRPDIYAVNEDGDRPEKREYCEAHQIEYRVLKRLPKEGLTARESTTLRGF